MQQLASRLTSSFLILCLVLFSAAEAVSQPLLVVTVPDTVLTADYNGQTIPVYLDNFEDSVGAFHLTFVSSRPDLVKFAGFDATGTLISDFDYVEAFNMAGDSSIIQVFCQAITASGSNPVEGFAPQQGGVAVFLRLTVADKIDSTGDNRADIRIILPGGFSTPGGQSIGAAPVVVIDTTYYLCLEWESTYCLDYAEVDPDSVGFDSLSVSSRIVPGFDSNLVWLTNGSVSLIPPPCGVCDLDCTGELDIGDLTALIRYLFAESSYSGPYVYCDWDDDTLVDIADLTALIRYLFLGGDPPH